MMTILTFNQFYLLNLDKKKQIGYAMGIEITAFGAEAALLITIAFMFQQQAIVLFNRLVVLRVLSEKVSERCPVYSIFTAADVEMKGTWTIV